MSRFPLLFHKSIQVFLTMKYRFIKEILKLRSSSGGLGEERGGMGVEEVWPEVIPQGSWEMPGRNARPSLTASIST